VQSLQYHYEPRIHSRSLPRHQPLRRQPAADDRRISRLSRAGCRKSNVVYRIVTVSGSVVCPIDNIWQTPRQIPKGSWRRPSHPRPSTPAGRWVMDVRLFDSQRNSPVRFTVTAAATGALGTGLTASRCPPGGERSIGEAHDWIVGITTLADDRRDVAGRRRLCWCPSQRKEGEGS
jgi:hypothetical protein